MKVFDVEPEGNPENMDDRYACGLDEGGQSELLKDCNVQMEITINRKSPLADKFKYKEPFLIYINVP